MNNTCYYWPNSSQRTEYLKANAKDIFEEASSDSDGAVQVKGSSIKYRWLGKEYWVECLVTCMPSLE